MVQVRSRESAGVSGSRRTRAFFTTQWGGVDRRVVGQLAGSRRRCGLWSGWG